MVLLGPFLDVLEGPHRGRLVVRVDLDAKEQRQHDNPARQLQIGGEECLVSDLAHGKVLEGLLGPRLLVCVRVGGGVREVLERRVGIDRVLAACVGAGGLRLE